ncbi:DUF262 domain-containing protein [Desulfosporosinus burensis]
MEDAQSSESMKNMMDTIDKKRVMLPEFQRDFVWEMGKTYDLFDSLVRDIFVGSIIYGIPSFEVTVREIDNRPRKMSGKKRKSLEVFSYSKEEIGTKVDVEHFRLILDGQQRITSLYRAIKGTDEVWCILKNEDELADLIENKEFKEMTLEEVLREFSGQQESNRLSLKISDIYFIMESDLFEEEIRQKFFNELLFVKGKEEEEKKIYFRRYLIFAKKLQDLFKAEKLISYYLLNMSSEKFALFFERSNSKGIQLNFIDILCAKLYAGFNLRKKVEEFEQLNGDKYRLDRETIVRTISYIVSHGKNVDKSYILASLNYEDFNNYWDEICELYKKALNFLYDNFYIISQSWMPYFNMIIPIIIFLQNLPSKDFSQMTEKQRTFLNFWYWSSVFAQRYGGGTNEVIVHDCTVLELIAMQKKVTDKSYFTKLRAQIEVEDIYSLSKNSSVYKGILNLINFTSGGLRDWNNSTRITFNSKLEDHHVFPREFLKEQLGDDSNELMDCVANKVLIPKILNIKIGKKGPSTYLKEISYRNTLLHESLKSHLLPVDLIDGAFDDFFEVFVEDRAKEIVRIVKETVVDKRDLIINSYYEPVKKKSVSYSVFAFYRNKKVEATFNSDSQEILYKGAKYSVSGSVNKAKQDLSGKESTSTNGWKFWRFINDDNQERYIDELR